MTADGDSAKICIKMKRRPQHGQGFAGRRMDPRGRERLGNLVGSEQASWPVMVVELVDFL